VAHSAGFPAALSWTPPRVRLSLRKAVWNSTGATNTNRKSGAAADQTAQLAGDIGIR
jgi:hypothetical protein